MGFTTPATKEIDVPEPTHTWPEAPELPVEAPVEVPELVPV